MHHPNVATARDGYGCLCVSEYDARMASLSADDAESKAEETVTTARGLLAEASECFNDALDIRCSMLGDEHPFVAT